MNGYVEIWEPTHPLAFGTGYVLEHRKVMWDAGLLTDPADHVHHIDHNKSNNDISNLEVKDPSTHAADHAAAAGYIVNQFGTWPIGGARERQRMYDKRRRSIIRQAAALLELGYKEYISIHGESIHTAARIIETEGATD